MRLKSGDVAYQETFHGIHGWQCRHWIDSPQAPTTSQRQCNPPNPPDTEVYGKNIWEQQKIYVTMKKMLKNTFKYNVPRISEGFI